MFASLFFFLRKEVIQPHLPIRLPCYDLTLIINPTFGGVLLAVRLPTSGVANSHGLTGGVYKARERIHRLGYTRTTMALNKEKQDREVEQNSKTTSQFRLQAATRLHEVGIASNRGSACRGEYVPGPCTHRPSHHESRGDPKSIV